MKIILLILSTIAFIGCTSTKKTSYCDIVEAGYSTVNTCHKSSDLSL